MKDEKPIKLKPQYFPPDKKDKPLFFDWPIWRGGRWSRYVPDPIEKTENQNEQS